MNKESGKITSFTDLNAWKEGHQLVLMVYRLVKKFPNDELFGLTSQMKRSSVSITSNIAEGFSRQSYKEKIQFYYIAQGPLTELQNQILIARDIKLIDDIKFNEAAQQSIKTHKIITGLIKSSRNHTP